MNYKELNRYYKLYGHFPKGKLTIKEVIIAILGFITIVLLVAIILI